MRSHRQAVERARADAAGAWAGVTNSQAQRQHVDIKHAEVETARALLQQAQANLDFARLQLSHTVLRAPIAGIIAKNHLEVGQVLQPGRPLLAMVPLYHVWVEANFKKTQLRYMRPGHKTILHIDAFPDQIRHGEVVKALVLELEQSLASYHWKMLPGTSSKSFSVFP